MRLHFLSSHSFPTSINAHPTDTDSLSRNRGDSLEYCPTVQYAGEQEQEGEALYYDAGRGLTDLKFFGE